MNQYNSVKVKLSSSQLNKLQSDHHQIGFSLNMAPWSKVIIAKQVHSAKPELDSVQVQILIKPCSRFAMVKISPAWK